MKTDLSGISVDFEVVDGFSSVGGSVMDDFGVQVRSYILEGVLGCFYLSLLLGSVLGRI